MILTIHRLNITRNQGIRFNRLLPTEVANNHYLLILNWMVNFVIMNNDYLIHNQMCF